MYEVQIKHEPIATNTDHIENLQKLQFKLILTPKRRLYKGFPVFFYQKCYRIKRVLTTRRLIIINFQVFGGNEISFGNKGQEREAVGCLEGEGLIWHEKRAGGFPQLMLMSGYYTMTL